MQVCPDDVITDIANGENIAKHREQLGDGIVDLIIAMTA
jgi:hypothetical protein